MKKRAIAACAAGASVYAGICALLHFEIFNKNAGLPQKIYTATKPRFTSEKPSKPDPRSEWIKQQNFEELTLVNGDGHTLRAFYLPAEKETDRFLIGAHGYRSRGKGEFRLMAKYYHEKGFHILLVDHRAAGESEGKLITFGKKESEDLMLWIDKIRTDYCETAEIILHGVSMGAATVLMLSDNEKILPNVKFIVADCGYTSATDEFKSVLKSMHVPSGALIHGVNAINKAVSGFSLFDAAPQAHVKDACVPILFIHGGSDDFVPTFMSRSNYEACTGEKDILIIDGAKHAESYPTDSEAYEKKLNEFIEKYIPKKCEAAQDNS